ncbi:hypothetical protein ACTHSJ_22125, partial [Paenibacillus cellulositrophicus]|uniref:hypothetical protein n=1 Tax=Paenibacillus cellulositrophicus TaxID=562959 RepID=UPI003F7E7031
VGVKSLFYVRKSLRLKASDYCKTLIIRKTLIGVTNIEENGGSQTIGRQKRPGRNGPGLFSAAYGDGRVALAICLFTVQ